LDDLDKLRIRIDEIDAEIVQLLKNRYENAKLLGRLKRARGIALRDREREKVILARVKHLSSKLGFDQDQVAPVFRRVFDLAVEAQDASSIRHSPDLGGLKVLVVGGGGEMGRFFARFAALEGASVKIVDKEISITREAAKELEVEPGTILDVVKSDIVILAVPVEDMVRVAVETGSLMTSQSLLLDISSVKTGICDKILERIPKEIEYVSVHPLFGPRTDHLQGQSMIAVRLKQGPKWSRLLRVLERAGAGIHFMSADQHDRKMAYVQGLHHFALLSLGLGLGEFGDDPSTQSLRETEGKIGMLLENWQTIATIQRLNPHAALARAKFVELATKLSNAKNGPGASVRRRLEVNVQKWSRKQ
jgi:chorismate mutase / prephenate dehydrogenase